MYVLHGSWLAANGDAKSGFLLWAETSGRLRSASPASAPAVAWHPFALRPPALRRALVDALPAAATILTRSGKPQSVVVYLPSAGAVPQASPELLLDQVMEGELRLSPWHVAALCLPADDAPGFLAGLPGEDDATPGVRLAADLRFWRLAGRLVLDMLAGQRFSPTLSRQDDRFLARWQPWPSASDTARLQRLAEAMPPLCRALTGGAAAPPRAARSLLDDFVAAAVDAFVRRRAALGRRQDQSPASTSEAWLNALVSGDGIVRGSPASLALFYDQFRAWMQPVSGEGADASFRLCFRLDAPLAPSATGILAPLPMAQDWTLHYFLQASDDPSLLAPARAVWSASSGAVRFLDRTFVAAQERLLAGLGRASRIFPPIEASLRSAQPDHCALTAEEAYTFMRETAILLQGSGFGALVPNLASKLSVRLRARSQARSSPKGGVGGLSFDTLVEYDWQLALGGEPLTRQEFEALAALKTPLVQVRGQWVEVRPDQIQQAVRFWEKQQQAGPVSLQEAMQVLLAPQGSVVGGLPIGEVVLDDWLDEIVGRLASGGRVAPAPAPASFQGALRPYQAVGLSWLAFLRRWRLGACLADDMGLGKTIQVIALLLHEREQAADQPGEGQRPALLICPTSVVGNWQRELQRFAPSIRLLVHHGAERKKSTLAQQAAEADIVISSYALLHRDEKHLSTVEWGDVILDEAQNIKNPSTKQAQAARQLPAQWRVALTGTPVENRLSELWSIFQFLNPGYLGSQESFRKNLALPIERASDAAAASRLKSLVGPFILRRVKTDPTVISDLPQKNEMKVFCTLTREQATLYEAVVRDSMQRVEEVEGIERRGVVLAMIMKLKQVCNHPAQFLGDGSALPGRSGKLARLVEMLEEVRSVKERALIFTQFAEMGRLLEVNLEETFGHDVLFLHGGTPAKQRDKMVERFQNDPNAPLVFVLSIKAGGTGLNLTRANHVFHFDRWWNPAVENQATDRAYRIGQRRNVQIYKYLCAGTFEERIDEMIERKKDLAERIVGTSEAWITEMTTAQLRDVFALRSSAIPAEEST